MPPPSHVHPGLLVTNKPDLPRPKRDSPPAVGPTCSLSRGATGTADKCASRLFCRRFLVTGHCAASAQSLDSEQPSGFCFLVPCRVAALAQHDGPTAFAIPGNHDWIDGLETFQRHILHKVCCSPC